MYREYRIKPTAGIYNILLGVCAVTNDTGKLRLFAPVASFSFIAFPYCLPGLLF